MAGARWIFLAGQVAWSEDLQFGFDGQDNSDVPFAYIVPNCREL